MLSKEDWIASHRKQFPDARPDVLGFIYDFSSRSSDLYEVFVNGYCFYFANMLREALMAAMFVGQLEEVMLSGWTITM